MSASQLEERIWFADVDPGWQVTGGRYIQGTIAVKFRYDAVTDMLKVVLREEEREGSGRSSCFFLSPMLGWLRR